MKKGMILILTLLVPCFLLLEVWGVFRYDKLGNEVAKIEQEQSDWIERNKKTILGIAYYSSPERVNKIVKNDLKLEKTSVSEFLKIEFSDKQE
jgi:cell division protein FtsL